MCFLRLKTGATQHEEAGDVLGGPSPKKQRHVWTPEAHHKFSKIVEGLGDSKQACHLSASGQAESKYVLSH
jgi:hypothetical protein